MKALRKARLTKGLTQAQVAEQLGKPQQIVSQLESGNRRIDVIELVRLCDGLDVLLFLASLRLQPARIRKRQTINPSPRGQQSKRR